MKEYLDLLLTFAKIGCFTFGGGYAMVPVVERELIRGKGWTTMEEVMDYYTIAQVTPGIIAVNLSTFIGYKRKGPLGGIVSTLGFLLPGVGLMALVSAFVVRFAEYPALRHVFTGLRAAVGALVLDTVIKLLKGFFRDGKAMVIFIAALALSILFSASPALIVAGAGIAGFFLYGRGGGRKAGEGGGGRKAGERKRLREEAGGGRWAGGSGAP
ncbi:MAG: chromate transporter [Treponema sp.]|nr:chromate transporter [Treponema sp.]